eukprot:scaffold607966_cov55-Prasinocladus_malaysianus.AAC.1
MARQKRPELLVVSIVIAVTHHIVSTEGREWTPKTLPNPWTNHEACNRPHPSWVCDPDGLMSEQDQNLVEGITKAIAQGDEPYALLPCGETKRAGAQEASDVDRLAPVNDQVAVAVIEQMDPSYAGTDLARAAEKFARKIHDIWGVGDAECNNGVVLFLTVKDRRVYVSTGAGVKNRLPGRNS